MERKAALTGQPYDCRHGRKTHHLSRRIAPYGEDGARGGETGSRLLVKEKQRYRFVLVRLDHGLIAVHDALKHGVGLGNHVLCVGHIE